MCNNMNIREFDANCLDRRHLIYSLVFKGFKGKTGTHLLKSAFTFIETIKK